MFGVLRVVLVSALLEENLRNTASAHNDENNQY